MVKEDQEQGQDGAEVHDSDNSSSALNTLCNTLNNTFENECVDKAVGLVNTRPICQSKDDSKGFQGVATTDFVVVYRGRLGEYGT